ncbi:MAG: LppX_LprAFG lipoprotein [Ardenticatenaceae bacterium]|nr:LppX_LprAFG lipoprotein [Ardenticatenaceae bacterium]
MVWRWLLLLLLVMSLAACDTEEVPTVSPEEIVQKTADSLNQLPGFHFIIERTGAPAFVDPDGLIAFRRAEGDYTAPDKARAIVRVIAPGLVTEVNVISIGAVQWQTNIVTGAWEELPPNWGFNPAVLFDPAVGLPAILQNDLSELQLVGTEPLEGVTNDAVYRLTAVVAGDSIYQMSGTLIGPEAVTAEFWVDPATFHPLRILVTEPVPGSDEPSLWQVDFSQMGEVVAIEPPGEE